MKISGVDKGISTYKTYISEFGFQWIQVRPIFWPDHHYRARGKCSNASYSESTGETLLVISKLSCVRLFSMTHIYVALTPWPLLRVIRGHMRSNAFFVYNIWWNRDRSVRLVPKVFSRRDALTDMQHDLSRSRRDLDLRSNFDLDLSRSTCICFDASWQEEHDGVRIIPIAFLVQKLFAKKRFLSKTSILTFLDLFSELSWL